MSPAVLFARALLALAPLVPSLQEVPARMARTPPVLHPLALSDEGELELVARWEACVSSTYGLFESTPALRSPKPAQELARHGAAEFRPFLPPRSVSLGETWKVDDSAVLPFLRQLHAGARSRAPMPGGEVPGTYACLRAVSENAAEILLRAHAVFELEDGVIYRPAQFEGRLLLEQPSGRLLAFQLALPSRDTNVDVNVPQEVDRGGTRVQAIAADIGWVPRLELVSPPAPEIAWSESMPDEAARLALRRCFYAFAALDWLPFEEAVMRSRAEGKPLHLVALFGALDDDSC